MLQYLLEFTLCSALFYALYRLLLEGRTAHRAARAYLVGSMLLSLLIPLLELPLYPAQTIYYELPITLWEDIMTTSPSARNDASTPIINWVEMFQRVGLIIYLLVSTLNFAVVARKLWLINRLRHSAQLSFYEAYTLAESDHVVEPFSFWRTIFLARRYTPREREQIIAHEASHVRHRHTAERLWFELLRCVCWFNPFVWVTSNALAEVQEWEADMDVLHQGYDVYEYRQLIFRQLFGYNPDIASGLKSQTSKKRFLMMTNSKKGKLSLVRYGAVITLVAVMVLAFGAVRAEAEITSQSMEPMQSQQMTDEEKSVVYILADGTIKFNNEVVTLEELQKQLEDYRAIVGASAVLTIKAEDNTRVGILDDVKSVARSAKVLRIRYDVPMGEMTTQILPPPLTTDANAKVTVEVVEHIADHNLLTLYINARGDVLTTRPDGKQAVVDVVELKSIIKAFIDNSESVAGKRQVKNKNYSDFTWQTIKRGDGEVHYPVSNGVISIVNVRETPIDKYNEIQKVIIDAYAELREELAKRSFSKSFDALDIDQRRFDMRAIPVKESEIN